MNSTLSIKEIKSELRSLDTKTLLDLLPYVSDEIFSTDLDELLVDYSPSEILKALEYGSFSADDDYFALDNFGNLNSYSEGELKDYILSYYEDDLVEYIMNFSE